jgi:hypothetical protein
LEILTMRARTWYGPVWLTGALLSGCGTHPLPTGASDEAPATASGTASVTAAPAIGVTPTSFGCSVYAFRPAYNPPGQTLTITNAGGGRLNWKATDNGWWLTLGSTSGTAPSTVRVRVNRASLPIGLNGWRPQFLRATITVSATGASNTPRTIPVSLFISYQR